VPDDTALAGHRLVIDNASGTYAPPSEHLQLMSTLFERNFPGIRVETVPVGDPRLQQYHAQAPSRLGSAAAATAANGARQ